MVDSGIFCICFTAPTSILRNSRWTCYVIVLEAIQLIGSCMSSLIMSNSSPKKYFQVPGSKERTNHLGTDAAFGMNYLHNKNIVQFDLKSENLLVNLRDPRHPICKI